MPIQSMTGYGRGEASGREVTVICELRSVNNRFRDVQVRVPREYMALEPRIVQTLKEPFARGRIDAFVRRQAARPPQAVRHDPHLAAQYLRACKAIAPDAEVPWAFILAQPGVLTLDEVDVDVSAEWDVVDLAIQSAVADLTAMRQREGVALVADLRTHATHLVSGLDEVAQASAGLDARLRARLEARIRRMIADRIDNDRLLQEVALQADKADISEEIARLRSHVDQMEAILDDRAATTDGDAAMGRRLDFLIQEMNREVNTIGSKAAESAVNHRVVEMKSTLERLREQAANLE